MALAEALLELQELTERLRRDCPWDREQTARTIVPHTVEEAYEVADAALADDDAKLLDELGDLLFQVYFLALLLAEQGAGDLEAVARGVHEKLVRRHPHVFGEAEADTPGASARTGSRSSASRRGARAIFHDVPETLPALLLRAQGAAARGGGRLRVPGRRRARSPTSTTSSRELREALAASASRRPRPSPTRASSTSSATCSSRASTSRGG